MANFDVGGFQITQDPPSPTGYNDFADNSQLSPLGESTVEVIPLQVLNLTSSNPDDTGIFRLADNENIKFNSGANCFIIPPKSNLSFTLDLDNSVPLIPINFSIIIAVETTETTEAKFNVSVNGHDQSDIEENGGSSNVYHVVTWQIAANILKTGRNTFSIGNSRHSKNKIWISEARIVSALEQTINAFYYWKSVFTCTVDPSGSVSKSVSITKGTTTSDADTFSFAETIGLSVEGKAEVPLLAEVSYTINTSFTATQGVTHTVAITQSETDTTSMGINNPSEEISAQFWQLCLRFESNGKYIEQLIGVDNKPGIIETCYPAEATANVLIQK